MCVEIAFDSLHIIHQYYDNNIDVVSVFSILPFHTHAILQVRILYSPTHVLLPFY